MSDITGACRGFPNSCGTNLFNLENFVSATPKLLSAALDFWLNLFLIKIAYLHAVEIMLVYTRLGDLKIR